MQLTIRVWLEDKPGALMLVTGILSAKGSNIVSLSMAPDGERAGTARVTIVAEVDERLHGRMVKKIGRLESVLMAEVS